MSSGSLLLGRWRGQAGLASAQRTRPIQPLPASTGPRHDGYFVDLFVRVSNAVAINMYTKVRAGLEG